MSQKKKQLEVKRFTVRSFAITTNIRTGLSPNTNPCTNVTNGCTANVSNSGPRTNCYPSKLAG